MSLEELFLVFKTEAFDQNIDPDDQYDWDHVAFGFAIAKGCSRADAATLSIFWHKYCIDPSAMEYILRNRVLPEDFE